MADTKTTALTANTDPQVADLLVIVDDPGGSPVTQKITLTNFYKSINGLTEDTAPDGSADFVATYDASATAAKKVAFGAGTYTPTLTNTTNVAASTAFECQYMRVGNVVTVSGEVDIDATATGNAVLNMSLPIASNLTAATQVGGVAFAALIQQGFAILADTSANNALFRGNLSDAANRSYWFSFTYQIL